MNDRASACRRTVGLECVRVCTYVWVVLHVSIVLIMIHTISAQCNFRNANACSEIYAIYCIHKAFGAIANYTCRIRVYTTKQFDMWSLMGQLRISTIAKDVFIRSTWPRLWISKLLGNFEALPHSNTYTCTAHRSNLPRTPGQTSHMHDIYVLKAEASHA